MGKFLTAVIVAGLVNALLYMSLVHLNRLSSQEPAPLPAQRELTVAIVNLSPDQTPRPADEAPSDQRRPDVSAAVPDTTSPPLPLSPVQPVPLFFDNVVPVVTPADPVPAAPPAPPMTDPQPGGSRPGEESARAGDTPMLTGDIDQPPVEITGLNPSYPEIARRRKIEGDVRVELLIDEAGRIDRMTILSVSGHPAFRQAVLEMADTWRFTAPRHRGKPVKVRAVKTIQFQLR
ncbi:MAG: TonB family protein [Lentisphaeria bacterium]|nr:TonB family protein [Lentisphaeria bacterium]